MIFKDVVLGGDPVKRIVGNANKQEYSAKKMQVGGPVTYVPFASMPLYQFPSNNVHEQAKEKKLEKPVYSRSSSYIIKNGDTLNKIAQENGITVAELAKVNNIIDPDIIKAGQSITIPSRHDLDIAQSENYGWNNPKDRGVYTKEKLSNNLDAAAGFDPLSYILNGLSYMFDFGAGKDSFARKEDQAYFDRHLGYPRDFKYMPMTAVRFAGDFNEDGSLKYPSAEYTGLSEVQKNIIRDAIANGEIKPGDKWVNATDNTGLVSPLAKFAIRENNNSGIYDIFDTYDFRKWYQKSIPNRSNGFDIEIRDTIHGPNAQPEKYKSYIPQKMDGGPISRYGSCR